MPAATVENCYETASLSSQSGSSTAKPTGWTSMVELDFAFWVDLYGGTGLFVEPISWCGRKHVLKLLSAVILTTNLHEPFL